MSSELERVKERARASILNCVYLKATIIPYKGEFHVLTPGSRDVFTTHEAACAWVASFFMVASIMTLEKILEAEGDDQGVTG